jgi:hypothetical protein
MTLVLHLNAVFKTGAGSGTTRASEIRECHLANPAAGQQAAHSRTSYSKATPSGSFSSNHLSAASRLANTLR